MLSLANYINFNLQYTVCDSRPSKDNNHIIVDSISLKYKVHIGWILTQVLAIRFTNIYFEA